MADDREVLDRLLGGTSGDTKRLGGRAEAPRDESAPLKIIYVTDITNSMEWVVDEVQKVIADVGTYNLRAGTDTEAAVFGVSEHRQRMSGPLGWILQKVFGSYWGGFTPGMLKADGVEVLRDALQTHPFTRDPAELERQVANLVLEGRMPHPDYDGDGPRVIHVGSGANFDNPEAYECGAQLIQNEIIIPGRRADPNARYLVVWFGDVGPHGMNDWSDRGCPYGVPPTAIRDLAQIADQSFWVDCVADALLPGQESSFQLRTYRPISDLSNTHYLRFEEASPFLKSVLTAMGERTRGPRAGREYEETLEPEEREVVSRLLLTSGSGPLDRT